MATGKVTELGNPGFIQRDDGKDFGYSGSIAVGTKVSFDIGMTPEGLPIAVNVKPVGALASVAAATRGPAKKAAAKKAPAKKAAAKKAPAKKAAAKKAPAKKAAAKKAPAKKAGKK